MWTEVVAMQVTRKLFKKQSEREKIDEKGFERIQKSMKSIRLP